MNPAGRIDTIMDLRKVKEYWFNIPLLVFHLTFMVAGTILGKIKETCDNPNWIFGSIIITLNVCGLVGLVVQGIYWYSPLSIVGIIIGLGEGRGIIWRKVWQAAQVSHVRLVLEPAMTLDGVSDQYFWVMNFGYKYAEIQIWDIGWNDGKRFKYYEATFPTPPEFMEPVIQYAHDQVGKQYDEVQLLSYFPHLIVWIIFPPCWGKELKIIKALNRPGGLEDCISGFTACLRWPERDFVKEYSMATVMTLKRVRAAIIKNTKFFKGYAIPVVPPCLAVISENWREK